MANSSAQHGAPSDSVGALNDDAGIAAIEALFETVNASIGTDKLDVDTSNISANGTVAEASALGQREIVPGCSVNEDVLGGRPAPNPVCYVIPVHEPKFDLLHVFLESHAKYGQDTDAAAVFSSEASRSSFYYKHLPWSNHPEVRLLVFCGSPAWTAGLNTHVVFYKKWWAVLTLGRAYKFYILADAELFVLQPFRVLDFAVDFFAAKTFYGRNLIYNSAGGPKARLHEINKVSGWRFAGDARAKLEAKTEHYGLYFWFNEVPIVETETALGYVGALLPGKPPFTKNEKARRILEFDWLSYAYYLVVHHDFKVLNVDTELSRHGNHVPADYAGRLSLGEDGGGPREFVELVQPHWTNICGSIKDRTKFNQSRLFLVFHLDRCAYPPEVDSV
jgi:hypothetical protein